MKTRAQREAEADRREDERIARRVRGLIGAAQIDQERLSAMLGISRVTLGRRLKNPGDFTVTELRRLIRAEKALGEEGAGWLISA